MFLARERAHEPCLSGTPGRMRLHLRWMLFGTLACCLGCSGPNSLLARRTTIGTLKTSVSQLEFEKEQLTKNVDELKADNHRLANRLSQEEAANGELTARLDDARVLLRSRGYDSDALAAPSRSSPEPRRTAPVRRQQRPGRKPPFARIPGYVEPSPPADSDDEPVDPLDAPARPAPDDPGPQSRRERPSQWHRVASRASYAETR